MNFLTDVYLVIVEGKDASDKAPTILLPTRLSDANLNRD
jgi:hypothetical protein